MQARYYDPVIGRFLSIDPVDFIGSGGNPAYFNRYAYSGNDPINNIDPDGQFFGAAGKLIKLAVKGGDIGATFAGAAQDVGTIFDGDASGLARLGAVASLATEVFSPVSARDAKAIAEKACFEAGTLVLTKDGKRAIETISAGDIVWSSDPETGQSGWKTVAKTFINDESSVWELTFADNEQQATVLHRVTGEHPYWVKSDDVWSWKTVSELQAGMVVETKNGKQLTVIDSHDTEVVKRTYNFEVEDFHTYYVGHEEILVHNNCVERVKHFTNKKGVTGIKESGTIKAGDTNSVFTVGAKTREAKGSPNDITDRLGIAPGRARNSVTFDAKPGEF